jgi:RES domain-containing protein
VTRTGWRIAPADKSTTAFDGEGARLYGGRWNPIGAPMVYASEHQSLAALEVRVHIDKTRMRKQYKCFAFHFDDDLLQIFPANQMPKDWRQEPPPPSLQRIGGDWLKSMASVVLAVPSVIIPTERNLLINPAHPDFRKLKIQPPTNFVFDYRLFD